MYFDDDSIAGWNLPNFVAFRSPSDIQTDTVKVFPD